MTHRRALTITIMLTTIAALKCLTIIKPDDLLHRFYSFFIAIAKRTHNSRRPLDSAPIIDSLVRTRSKWHNHVCMCERSIHCSKQRCQIIIAWKFSTGFQRNVFCIELQAKTFPQIKSRASFVLCPIKYLRKFAAIIVRESRSSIFYVFAMPLMDGSFVQWSVIRCRFRNLMDRVVLKI